jgi:hypothetical protein
VRREERVVKDWPDGGTYCLGSSQIRHVVTSEREVVGYCVPQVWQMRLSAVEDVEGS